MNVVEHQANGIEDQGLNPQLAAEVKRAKRLDTFKRLLAIALLLCILLVAVWALQYELSKPAVGREWIVFMVAGALLAGATMFFFRRGQDMRDPKNVRFVISYDVVVAIILGLSATFIQCANWAAGGLLAGACLFIGGFFGLLFGYPQGVAAQNSNPKAGAEVSAASSSKTLLAQSSATLGKVLAGFGLAKVGSMSGQFWNLCHTLGPVLGGRDQSTNYVLASLILAYFLATGFLSGLLLPSYFMSDFLKNSTGQDAST